MPWSLDSEWMLRSAGLFGHPSSTPRACRYYPAIYTAKDQGDRVITADYRLDCDVPVTYYTKWEYPDLKLMPVPFPEKRKVGPHQAHNVGGKNSKHGLTHDASVPPQDSLIAAFISNCGPKNNREEVLARLMEVRGWEVMLGCDPGCMPIITLIVAT